MAYDLLPAIQPLATGLFGGIGATLTWEMFLKPARERRALAQSLCEEIRYNARQAGEEDTRAAEFTHGVPRSSNLATVVFEAAAARVAELGGAAGEVFAYYRLVNLLRQLAAEHARLLYEHEHRTPFMSDARVEEIGAELSWLARRHETEFGRLHGMSIDLLPNLLHIAQAPHARLANAIRGKSLKDEPFDLIGSGHRDANLSRVRQPPNEALKLSGMHGRPATPAGTVSRNP